jgi:hypothetical protein
MSMKCILATLLAAATAAMATPSGLNNIPTTDTVPDRTVAVQAFSSFGGANQFAANGPGKQSFWMGFKTGLALSPFHLEWGLDSPLGGDRSGPLFFQTKVRTEPWEGGMFVLGIAGVAVTDIDRAGDPFSYAMLSHDFGFARFHAGYGLQTRGNSFLFGIDRNFKFLDRNLNLNADLVQTRDGDGLITAIGAKYDLTKHIVLESWVNIPDKEDVSVIAKINFVFTF